MAVTLERAASHDAEGHGPTGQLRRLTSTEHEVIGTSCMVTSVVMMVLGAALAMVIRELSSAASLLATGDGHSL